MKLNYPCSCRLQINTSKNKRERKKIIIKILYHVDENRFKLYSNSMKKEKKFAIYKETNFSFFFQIDIELSDSKITTIPKS